MKYRLDSDRLNAFDPVIEINDILEYVESWDKVIKGDPAGGPLAHEETSYRFRWITAPKSTIIQCSKVHPGLTAEPEKVLEKLFHEYV
jgi:hypothetical protein